MRRRSALAVALLLACVGQEEGLPEGAVAMVGNVALTPNDLASEHAQMGAYGQLRFRGAEGQTNLLEALIAAELLAQEATDAGLGDDPRVRYAVLEEIAAVYLSAELERRVPYESVAQDLEALRAHYDAHPEAFTEPEQRSAEGVLFRKRATAEDAQARLTVAAVGLEELGELVSTPLQARDDDTHPGFHSLLFDPDLGPGDRLAHPVLVGEELLVGRVKEVRPARRSDFDDPAVRERLTQAVRAPLVEAARAQLLAELAQAYPTRGG